MRNSRVLHRPHGRPRSKSQDIVKLLQESDVDRIAGLLPVKYQRMAVSPFTFFRGAAIIQARDLAHAPVSGITVQACGDCHLANFGGFASPERVLVFDINDFDETFPGPWEWDMKRLGASLVLAARDRSFSKTVANEAARAAAASYRERMSEFAEMKVLDAWYATVNAEQVKEYFRNDKDMSARLAKKQKQARSQNSEAVIPKLTEVVDGRRKIKDSPPVIYHFDEYAKNLEKGHARFIAEYVKSLQPDRQQLFQRYHLQDSAIKVVGVGSVGTRCYLALLLADDVDPLFLQVKEARRSVLELPNGRSRYSSSGCTGGGGPAPDARRERYLSGLGPHQTARLLLASVPGYEGLGRDRDLPACDPGWVRHSVWLGFGPGACQGW